MPKYEKRKSITPDEKNKLPHYSDLLAHILFHRGITNSEQAEKFIRPDYARDTHDPFLMKDLDVAVARIITAIRNKEKIAIYSDYDADGIPGAAMFHDFFRRINYENVMTYIPHRHNEGFGVNDDAVRDLAKKKVDLMITVDCGISDSGALELAEKLNIDVIVTDHHEPPHELPTAVAVIDPKRHDCMYPDKNLCGTGVAYKLIQGILSKERFGMKDGHEKWLLDMVGIATLSDMVPLVGENRVFAHYGLQVLRKSPRKGLRFLLSKLRISQKDITEDDVAFMITPRINAASRMGVPMDAFMFLTSEDDEEAKKQAEHLESINNERKGVVASLVKEVKKNIRSRHGENIPSVIVLGNPDWRPSLLGLAANTCAEEFRRPVFLWGRDGDGGIKGSCRSEGTTNVVELMRGVPRDVFTEFGGHKHSGGFGVSHELIHHLPEHLNNSYSTTHSGSSHDEVEKCYIDYELNIDDVNQELYQDVAKLSPFGVGNEKPMFLFRGVKPSTVRKFGKSNDHVEIVFGKANGSPLKAISFFGAKSVWAESLVAGKRFDLVASVEKSMFGNRPEIRLRIEDVIYS